MTVTSAGFVGTPIGTLIQRVQDRIDANLAEIGVEALSYDGTIEGAFVDAVAQVAWEMEQGEPAILDALSPETATGGSLARLAARAGVEWRPASYSRYTFTATATSGLTITYPAGALLEGGGTTGRSRWAVVADTTVTDAGADLIVQAVASGPEAMPSVGTTTLTRVTRVSGIASVTYDPSAGDPVSIGRLRESVASVRARIRRQRSTLRGPTRTGIRAALFAALDWLTAMSVSRPAAGQVAITVVPAPVGTDQTDALVAAIAEAVSASAETTGSSSQSYTYAGGDTDTISWSTGSTAAVTVTATLVLDAGVTLAQVTEAAEAAIESVFAGLDVGDALRWSTMLGALVDVDGIADVSALSLVQGATTADDAGEVITPSPSVLLVQSGTPTLGT